MAETALVPIEKLDPVALFVKRDIEWVKEVIRKGVDEIIGDATVETAAGRQKIKSAAYQVARSKTLFDKMGKDFTAKLRNELNETNAGRKEIVQWCDDFQREKRQPLTDWEEAERYRQAGHEQNIERMRLLADDRDENNEPIDVDNLRFQLKALESFESDWEEYADEAAQVREDCIAKLKGYIEAREKYEAEQAELEALRREAEERRQKEEAERLERERKEREERIAREAAERARREAEEKAQREREEAERKAYAAIKAKEAVERAAKEAAEKAERERIAAEERARLEKEFAIKQERERAEAEAKRIEQERIEKEAREKAEADRKAANKRHRARINREALACFELNGFDEEEANRIIELIASGAIDHITINY